MKKLALYIVVLISLNCYSQSISVDTNKYTVPELVNNVLINSPCVSASNITWKTGSTYNSSNGIGFFTNTNTKFPMKSGVILSTGDVNKAAGPNTTDLNDGTVNWPGDLNLENTLAQAGITMNSTNATILEFDFMPSSTKFSFDFLFASEEYGNYQCQFSDAFAFLLTNTSTGVTTNLAVVPNTNTPISVVTIRDLLYNSSCPSENATYFGSYNGGSAAANAAINFNGQTKLLNASATLTLNTLYHIKLVIADRDDSNSDSAIFIASDSFNIGQNVLGQDLTLINNNALCPGDTYALNSGLDVNDYTISWKKDGLTLPNETGSVLNVTQSGSYSITFQKKTNGCIPLTNTIKIEFLPQISAQNPINLYKCETGASIYTFDLTINEAKVRNGLDPLAKVTFHESLADADNNTNALPKSYTSNGNQTIYIRISVPNNPCYITKSFKLDLTPAPIANKPETLTKCTSANTSIFNLLTQNKDILNGQSIAIYTIKYFKTLADANNNVNEINPPQNFITGSCTVYFRVQNQTDATCYSVNSFDLIVSPKPLVDKIENITTCGDFALPALTNGNYFTAANGKGTPMFAGDVVSETQTIHIFNQPDGPNGCSASSSFIVKIIKPDELSPVGGEFCGNYTLPPLPEGNYFTEAGGLGTQLKAGSVIETSQTVYVYFKSITPPFCVIDTNFEIKILPNIDLGTFENVFDCTSYTLPKLNAGNYYTEPNGQGIKLNAGDVLTTTQSIFVYAKTANGCESEVSFSVIIGIETPIDISQCKPYKLPNLNVGNYYTGPKGTGQQIAEGTVISTDQTIYIYAQTANTSNCTDDIHFNISIAQPVIDILEDVNACESYTLPVLTSGEYYTESGGTGNKLSAGDVITSTATVYIYKQSLTSDCSNEVQFEININSKPPISSRSDIDICNYYILTELEYGNYYTGPNGTGTLLPAGTKITETQRIYIYATSLENNSCASENSFIITIFPIHADAPANVTICDSYALPVLNVGNYYTKTGGPTNNNLLHAGDVITASTTLYVYAESGERINCTDENSFTITINKSPIVAPIADVYACNTFTLPALAVGNYFTGSNGSGTMLNAGDIITTDQTIYVYAQTGTVPNCTDEKSFKVNLFNVDKLDDIAICESYTLGTLKTGNYFTQSNGNGTRLNPGDVIKNTQKIYIYASNPNNTSCVDESSFTVTIVKTPVVNPVPSSLTKTCDYDGINDGITAFDLSKLTVAVLGNQTSSEYKVEYFENQTDAAIGANPVVTTTLSKIFVKVSNTLAKTCYDIKSITLTVNKLSEPKPIDGIICFDSKTNTLLNPYTIQSGLSNLDHAFKWYNEAGDVVGNDSSYLATLSGTYTVTATSNATGCTSEEIPVVVSNSEPAVVIYEVSDDFANNQTLTITATGVGGNYEYMLDSGKYQDSPVFENISSGVHIVTVRDKNGCGNTLAEILVINYPKFFTPNGDGYNDSWNIKDLKDFANSSITIYDRQGKLITKISPNDYGWDGSYGGKLLPSTDYWFVVNYTKDGVQKEFKSHFTMKR